MKFLLMILAASFMSIGCSKEAEERALPETLTDQYDKAEMDAAIQTARSRVDEFLTALEINDADSYSVKAPIKDGDGIEHFWLVDISYKDGIFSGQIGNEPGIITNVTSGQDWKVNKEEISDWMYIKDDRIHGGFTIDPLLGSFPKEKADEMRAMLVR